MVRYVWGFDDTVIYTQCYEWMLKNKKGADNQPEIIYPIFNAMALCSHFCKFVVFGPHSFEAKPLNYIVKKR